MSDANDADNSLTPHDIMADIRQLRWDIQKRLGAIDHSLDVLYGAVGELRKLRASYVTDSASAKV